jgi:tRNA-specific 2-thiouridylase
MVILDEPTSSMDFKTKEKIIKLIKELSLDRNLIIITHDKNDFKKDLFVKVRSTGKLIKAKINIKDTTANIDLLEEELGIAPGQACVFYSKNHLGYKVLGGGWITG